MSEVKWYCCGELGEYILDQVESVLDGSITRQAFWFKMDRQGLSADEIRDLMYEEGIC